MNTRPTQRVETYCYRQSEKGLFDFSIPLSKRVAEINERGFVIKQVATTSFVEDGLHVIAYTFILEK